MEKLCYECGYPINKKDLTKEHIPAQCFYEGYNSSYKVNRITVYAHRDCNNKYSKIDHQLRDAIGISSNNPKTSRALIRKSIKSVLKSILRGSDSKEKFNLALRESTVQFNENDIKQIHIKNFKGIFIKEYGVPFPENHEIWFLTDGSENPKVIELVKGASELFDRNNCVWKISGHSDIFKYRVFAADGEGTIKSDKTGIEIIITCNMVYHEDTFCTIVASVYY